MVSKGLYFTLGLSEKESIMKKIIVVILVLLFITNISLCSEKSSLPELPPSIIYGNGLEVENVNEMQIIVEDLNNEASKIGLTKEDIITKCESKLRQFRIKPVEDTDAYLYVAVNVVGNGFSISIEFSRKVLYKVGNKTYYKYGTSTWSTIATGTYGQGKQNFILDGIDKYLEHFLNEYLKANGL
jgi:hypothetical protein